MSVVHNSDEKPVQSNSIYYIIRHLIPGIGKYKCES